MRTLLTMIFLTLIFDALSTSARLLRVFYAEPRDGSQTFKLLHSFCHVGIKILTIKTVWRQRNWHRRSPFMWRSLGCGADCCGASGRSRNASVAVNVTAERWTSTGFDVSGKSEHSSSCSHDMSYFHDSIHTRTCNAGRRRCVKLSFGSVLAGGACPSLICVIYSLRCALQATQKWLWPQWDISSELPTHRKELHFCCLASVSVFFW